MAMVFNEKNFKSEVLESDVPVMVDFWATWCMPCRMLGPVIEEIAAESEGAYKVGKVNVDENPGLASSYGVMNNSNRAGVQKRKGCGKIRGCCSKITAVNLLK